MFSLFMLLKDLLYNVTCSYWNKLIEKNGGWISSAPSGSAFPFVSARGSDCGQENSIQREGYLHCYILVHFPSMQSAATVWDTLHNRCRSILLDASYSCLKPGYGDGAWYHPNCDIWVGHATFSGFKDH